jgi:hypothetical protein
MHKQRIYIDTSVIGGYFDKEFSKWSVMLFDEFFAGKKIAVFSKITIDEVNRGPKKLKDLLDSIPEDFIEITELSEEVIKLAENYVKYKVLTRKFYDDALHIAASSVAYVDVLVSWNFKHIVNLKRINEYNAINVLMGYNSIEIRTPMEVLSYEKNR